MHDDFGTLKNLQVGLLVCFLYIRLSKANGTETASTVRALAAS